MDNVLDVFNQYLRFDLKEDDDIIDRLNHRYTGLLLLVCAGMITIYQENYNPVSCWTPSHFHGSWDKYTKSYCWVHNMHYIPFEDNLPSREEADDLEEMKYYQWIPFLLLFQALLFNVPSLFWHGLNQKAGIDADHILLAANRMELSTAAADEIDIDVVDKKRGEFKNMIVRQISRSLGLARHKRNQRDATGKRLRKKSLFSGYLLMVYLVSKFLYLGNIIFQFFFVSKVLGVSFITYGFEVMRGMWSEHDWTNSYDIAFPRVAFCDLEVRRLGNVHRYSTQCTLLLNMFTEKIYIGLWFWFIMLGVANLMGIITLILRIGTRSRLLFLRNHLSAENKIDTQRKSKLVDEFLDKYLQQDGVFLLRLISANTNAVVTSEVTAAVWDDWYKHKYSDDENHIEKEPFAGDAK